MMILSQFFPLDFSTTLTQWFVLTLALVVLLCFVILYFLVRKIYSYVEDKISLHTYRSNLHFIAEPEELLNEEDR